VSAHRDFALSVDSRGAACLILAQYRLCEYRGIEPVSPTRVEVVFSRRVQRDCELHGVELADYLIVARRAWTNL
jgi:hypothetical protein